MPPYVCLMCRVMKALVILPMKPLNSMPISSFFTVPYGYRMSMGISTNTGPGTCRIDVNGTALAVMILGVGVGTPERAAWKAARRVGARSSRLPTEALYLHKERRMES